MKAITKQFIEVRKYNSIGFRKKNKQSPHHLFSKMINKLKITSTTAIIQQPDFDLLRDCQIFIPT